MNPISRRAFGGVLAGVVSAFSSASGFVNHSILRRPYRKEVDEGPNPYMLYDCIRLKASALGAPLRIKVMAEGAPESALEMSISPRAGESILLRGVHGLRAETSVKVSIESRKPFTMAYVQTGFMHPGFRRVDGMVVYNDPFYKPHPESYMFERALPHHRILGGPSADVTYGGGGAA